MTQTLKAQPAKYMFDVEFDRPGRFGDLGANAIAAVKDAEREGYRKGFEAARQEAEQRAAEQLARIATEMQLIVARLAATETRLEREAVDVAHAIANQLSPALIAREPMAEIEALVLDVLTHVRSAPHVAIRIAPALAETAGVRLKRFAEERGFTSRLVVLPDDNMRGDDCLVEWADGGVVRNREAIERRITDAINGFLGADAPTATKA
jgi:flagellar assembly protein FliH